MGLSTTEYDALSPEEQAEHDAKAKKRQDEEQAALPYKWRQTLSDVDITVAVPEETRAKQLAIEIKRNRISVGLKGQPPILTGELCKEIKVDESTWTLDDQREIAIHLEKATTSTWWDSVVQGHPKIDTTKIVPENSKLSELDGETRAMVEKMMFDNQQKQLGKPTSDEMKKLEMLEKFKKSNPQLDFSQAKISWPRPLFNRGPS